MKTIIPPPADCRCIFRQRRRCILSDQRRSYRRAGAASERDRHQRCGSRRRHHRQRRVRRPDRNLPFARSRHHRLAASQSGSRNTCERTRSLVSIPKISREISVTRLSRTLTSKDIEHQVARALERRNGMGEAANITISFDRDLRVLQLDSSNTGDLQPSFHALRSAERSFRRFV